jgi:AraC-like DNA-binding protein
MARVRNLKHQPGEIHGQLEYQKQHADFAYYFWIVSMNCAWRVLCTIRTLPDMRGASTVHHRELRNSDVVYGEVGGSPVEDLPAFLLNHCRLDAVQLEQGASCCNLDYVVGSQLVICRKHISVPLHLRGVMARGCVGLGLVRSPEGADNSGHPGRDDLLHLALPDVPFDWYLRAGQTLLLVMTGVDALLELARAAHAEKAVKEVTGSADSSPMLRADKAAVAEARGVLNDLLEGARRGEMEHNGASLGRAVREAMLMLLDGADEGAGRCSSETLVRRAREIVGDSPRRFSVSALSRELRLSPRTLHRAFFDVTGVGPHAYFLRQRLNAARRLLAAADGQQESVTNIALELGFTELGRFAGRYRAFFGESPSQTLQRPRRRIEPVPA